jgi:hypothetical protein
MPSLPLPEIVSCFFDESVQPHLPAMLLRWDLQAPGLNDGVWHLPDGVVLKGAAPERFGVTIERRHPNVFRVRVLWNHLNLIWDHLSRRQILASSLTPLLEALGTDLWYLLEQPIAERQAA